MWPVIGAELAARVGAPGEVTTVTWVPTPRVRAHRRGGDHAAHLARDVAQRLGRDCVRQLDVAVSSEGERYVPAVGCRHVDGATILLVDDVLTSGRTAARAALVLRASGVRDVWLAVAARAGSHALLAA
ncbi:MAG: phosphoribosyltransferase family protein [Nitriliruptoraceae bacterium]